MKVLGIEDFFYVPDRSYDFLAEKSLPYYHEAHGMLVASLGFDREADIEVLDLGVGSGVTSAYVLRNFPKAKVVGVDLFEEMIEEARIRLKPFEGRVRLIQSDNTEFLKRLDRKVHAVVSAFCLHHLDEEGKKEIFGLIHDRLLPGGRFLMLDLTTFEDPHLKEVARRATIDHMAANVDDQGYREKWTHHWNEVNTPSPADDMVRWMKELGFRAEIVFRSYEVALLSANRQ